MDWHQYQLIIWAWGAIGGFTFFYLLQENAPFGRHNRAGWGPTVDNRLGWVVMEISVLVVLFWTITVEGLVPGSLPVTLMLGLFTAHYLHRSLVFPFFLRTSGKRMPLVIMLSAMTFNTVNGFLIAYFFSHFADYPTNWFSDPRFIFGLFLFLTGMWINIQSDYQLIRLRKRIDTAYKIPRGSWFRYLSCPNHFGEILEWTGFAILSWSLPFAAFAFWTLANLLPRALAHHNWYKTQFSDYPADRKAIFPFVL